MNASPRRIFATLVLVLMVIFAPDCAREQTLTAIQIQPSGATFGDINPALFINFKAFGTYEHPPQTKDITNTVTWQSDNPQVAAPNSTGSVSPTVGCGTANIFATMHDHASGSDVVSNAASVVVNGPAALGCTPAGPQPVLTVQVASAAGTSATGTVTSSPPGITCNVGATCSSTFTIGTTITLTATPSGSSSFSSWSGCNSANGTICTVNLQSSITVTATFN